MFDKTFILFLKKCTLCRRTQIAKITCTNIGILLTKTTAAQNGVALSYRKVRGLYFLAVVFVRHIVALRTKCTIETVRLLNQSEKLITNCFRLLQLLLQKKKFTTIS